MQKGKRGERSQENAGFILWMQNGRKLGRKSSESKSLPKRAQRAPQKKETNSKKIRFKKKRKKCSKKRFTPPPFDWTANDVAKGNVPKENEVQHGKLLSNKKHNINNILHNQKRTGTFNLQEQQNKTKTCLLEKRGGQGKPSNFTGVPRQGVAQTQFPSRGGRGSHRPPSSCLQGPPSCPSSWGP